MLVEPVMIADGAAEGITDAVDVGVHDDPRGLTALTGSGLNRPHRETTDQSERVSTTLTGRSGVADDGLRAVLRLLDLGGVRGGEVIQGSFKNGTRGGIQG